MWVIGLLIACGWMAVAGQTQPSQAFTKADKLADDEVTGMVQSKDGYLWITTKGGLNRYDGTNFRRFRPSEGLASSDDLMRPFVDTRGRIWFYIKSAEFGFVKEGNIFTKANACWLGNMALPSNAPPMTIGEDKEGRLWVANSREFVRLEDTVVTEEGPIHPLGSGKIGGFGQFLMGNDGSVRLVGNRQVLLWKDTEFLTEKSAYPPVPGTFGAAIGDSILYPADTGIVLRRGTAESLVLPKRMLPEGIYTIFRDHRGNYLLGTWGNGFFQATLATDSTPLRIQPVLRDKGIKRFLHEDHEGNLWFSARHGMVMVPCGLSNAYWLDVASGLRSNFVTAMTLDGAGNAWLGNEFGDVEVWTNEGQLFHVLESDPLQPENPIIGIVAQPNGEVWVGRGKEIWQYKPTKTRPAFMQSPIVHSLPQEIHDFQPGLDGRASWTVVSDITACALDPESSFPNRLYETAVIQKYCHRWAPDGKLWMGTAKGLALYENGHDSYLPEVNALITAKIQDIAVWSGDTIILATDGQGVVVCTKGKVIAILNKASGMPSNDCNQLVCLDRRLWVATDNGIVEISSSPNGGPAIQRYSVSNGLSSNDIDAVAVDGQRIFAIGDNGVSVLPRSRRPSEATLPIAHIDSIIAGGKPLADSIIPWEDRDLRFRLLGIAYADPQSLQYQYRLVKSGGDTTWVASNGTEIAFPRLAAGDYRFEVRTSTCEGYWSPAESRRFTILAPYWQRAWFYVCIALLVLLIGYLIFRWRVAAVRRKFQSELALRSKITGLEQQAFQAMMNPHFIFNVMNSIRHYILRSDIELADRYLTRFAKLVRSNLQLVSKPLISLDEEMEFLRDYLSLEALRFQNGLEWEVTVEGELEEEELLLPSMLLQPYVENAIWHGLLPLEGPGTLRVVFKETEDGMLEVTISDDGVGFGNAEAVAEHVSKGMSLTTERLRLLGLMLGKEILVEIQPLDAGHATRPGTVVRLLLPMDLRPPSTA